MPMFSLDFGYRKSCDSRSRSFSRSSSDDTLQGSLKKAFGQPHYKVNSQGLNKRDVKAIKSKTKDMKTKAKDAASKALKSMSKTGGGSQDEEDYDFDNWETYLVGLVDWQSKLAKLMGRDAILGIKDGIDLSKSINSNKTSQMCTSSTSHENLCTERENIDDGQLKKANGVEPDKAGINSNATCKPKKSAVEACGKLDFGELELELYDSRYMLRGHKEPKWTGWCKPSCIPISIILVLIILVVTLSLLDQKWEEERSQKQIKLEQQWVECRKTCQIGLVESIPDGVTFNTTWKYPSTYDGWRTLLDLAENTIEIGSYYWTLQGNHVTANEGKDIFNRLMDAGKTRGIKIKIAQNIASSVSSNEDTKILEEAGAAEVRSLNFSRLALNGILHTKMWLVDRKHIYVGSANFDWRSLTQVKELGFVATNCSCLGNDLGKIFDVYWELGNNNSKIPDKWPIAYNTKYGRENPMRISFNGSKYEAYVSSSPPSFCPEGRTTDLDAIFDVIDNATEFVHIAVMDYEPAVVFTESPQYWPEIDNRLRKAAINRKVQIRLLIAEWSHTKNSTFNFLNSLQDLNNVYSHVNIEIKFFVVPANPDQEHIPFARVNHNKYMVTDKTAYIGTSNWSGDYFVSTGGVGFIATPFNSSTVSDFRTDLAKIFERDWYSSYTRPLMNMKNSGNNTDEMSSSGSHSAF